MQWRLFTLRLYFDNFLQVTFFSKHGNEEKLSQIDSQNMNFSLPDHVLAPTIWVCCKRIDAIALKEVRKIFWVCFTHQVCRTLNCCYLLYQNWMPKHSKLPFYYYRRCPRWIYGLRRKIYELTTYHNILLPYFKIWINKTKKLLICIDFIFV